MTELPAVLMYLLPGLLLGGGAGWLLAKWKYAHLIISKNEIEEKYVSRDFHQVLMEAKGQLERENSALREDLLAIEKVLSAKERDLLYSEEKLAHWEKDYEELQKRAHVEFENIANRLLEEKSKKFTDQNEKKLNDLLHPLRDKIREFGQDIDRRFTDEAKDVVSLKKEIENLKNLNSQLSTDAQNLASALKGNSKTQGDWGEFQLELLLEKAGLQKDTHYYAQPSFKDENGRDKRPDFIIQLPEGKHLIVDSKVSLTAYEKFFNEKDDIKRNAYLKEHTASIRGHIKDLSSKNYQQLYQINTPDYLLLFVPIEPAFATALQHDSKLFLDALEKNIVIVTTSTLLATMRTVSYIWRQELQKKNVLEIARQSGLLYDKFVGFVSDLQDMGQRLNQAQDSYHHAMNKLSDSKKYGDTLIGRAEKIKSLGAKTSKTLPKDLLEDEENAKDKSLL